MGAPWAKTVCVIQPSASGGAMLTPDCARPCLFPSRREHAHASTGRSMIRADRGEHGPHFRMYGYIYLVIPAAATEVAAAPTEVAAAAAIVATGVAAA